MIPKPPRPAHAELNLPIRLANGQNVATWSEMPALVEESSEELSEEELDEQPSEESSEETTSKFDVSVEELAHRFRRVEIEDATSKDAIAGPSFQDSDASLGRDFPLKTRSPALSLSDSSISPASGPDHPYCPSDNPSAPCVVRAREWVTNYVNNLPSGTRAHAKPADLRAYYLWRHEQVSAKDITSVYQNRRLELSTVVAYIFNAIRLENLPFEEEAAWALIPHSVDFLKKGNMAVITRRYPPKKRDGF